jgi:hypothetical protein
MVTKRLWNRPPELNASFFEPVPLVRVPGPALAESRPIIDQNQNSPVSIPVRVALGKHRRALGVGVLVFKSGRCSGRVWSMSGPGPGYAGVTGIPVGDMTGALHTNLLAWTSAVPTGTLVYKAAWCIAGPIPRPPKRRRGAGPAKHQTAVCIEIPAGAQANSLVYRRLSPNPDSVVYSTPTGLKTI